MTGTESTTQTGSMTFTGFTNGRRTGTFNGGTVQNMAGAAYNYNGKTVLLLAFCDYGAACGVGSIRQIGRRLCEPIISHIRYGPALQAGSVFIGYSILIVCIFPAHPAIR